MHMLLYILIYIRLWLKKKNDNNDNKENVYIYHRDNIKSHIERLFFSGFLYFSIYYVVVIKNILPL